MPKIYTIELTAEELSATIEAFNVSDAIVDGRPPLKNQSAIQQFSGGRFYRHVDGAGSTAWRKFVNAEAGL